MISKEKLKETIINIRSINGEVTFRYIPIATIYSIEKLYNLYYGSWNKIVVGEYFSNSRDTIKITDANLNDIVDKVYVILSDNVGDYILQAFSNLNLDYTTLKYFDRDPELLEKFQNEVIKIKNDCI